MQDSTQILDYQEFLDNFIYSLLQLLVHYLFLLLGLLAHYHLESPARLPLQIEVNELFRIDNVYSKSSKFYLE